MVIDFKKNADKLFSNTFYKLVNCKKKIKVLYGGAKSSKSYSAQQLEIIKIMDSSLRGDTLIIRKVQVAHKLSTYALFKIIIKGWGLESFFSFQELKITYRPLDRSFYFRGMDNPENIKSIAKLNHHYFINNYIIVIITEHHVI